MDSVDSVRAAVCRCGWGRSRRVACVPFDGGRAVVGGEVRVVPSSVLPGLLFCPSSSLVWVAVVVAAAVTAVACGRGDGGRRRVALPSPALHADRDYRS